MLIKALEPIERLAHVTNEVLEQTARDAEAVFPLIGKPPDTRVGTVTNFFNDPEYQRFVVGEGAELRDRDLLAARTRSVREMRCEMKDAEVSVRNAPGCFSGCP